MKPPLSNHLQPSRQPPAATPGTHPPAPAHHLASGVRRRLCPLTAWCLVSAHRLPPGVSHTARCPPLTTWRSPSVRPCVRASDAPPCLTSAAQRPSPGDAVRRSPCGDRCSAIAARCPPPAPTNPDSCLRLCVSASPRVATWLSTGPAGRWPTPPPLADPPPRCPSPRCTPPTSDAHCSLAVGRACYPGPPLLAYWLTICPSLTVPACRLLRAATQLPRTRSDSFIHLALVLKARPILANTPSTLTFEGSPACECGHLLDCLWARGDPTPRFSVLTAIGQEAARHAGQLILFYRSIQR